MVVDKKVEDKSEEERRKTQELKREVRWKTWAGDLDAMQPCLPPMLPLEMLLAGAERTADDAGHCTIAPVPACRRLTSFATSSTRSP